METYDEILITQSDEKTVFELIVMFLVDAIIVIGNNLVIVSYHLIMAGCAIMTASTLTGNNINFGEFVGVQSNTSQNTYASTITNSGKIIENMYGRAVTPLGGVHYIAGSTLNGTSSKTLQMGDAFDQYYYGRDYPNPCGTEIYAPFDASLSYQNNIGGGTPQLTLSKDGVKLHIMHLDVVNKNGNVSQGDLIGYVNKTGAYSGNTCHDHVSLYVDGRLADVETYGLQFPVEPVPEEEEEEEVNTPVQPAYKMPYRGWYGIGDAELHGRVNMKGVDVSGGCDTPLYAILSGRVTEVGEETQLSNGKRNSILTIRGFDGIHTATLLHGNYTPALNQRVFMGEQVGTEANIGNSTACHSHIILKENGVEINILQ